MMPVLVVIDGGLQEDPISPEITPRLRIPKLTLTTAPQGDSGAVAETARLLVNAQNPVIIADRASRTPAGMTRLIELAETLQAPVIDQGGRMNFPSRHPLNQSNGGRQLIANADVILGLELTDFWGTVDAFRDSLIRSSRSIVSCCSIRRRGSCRAPSRIRCRRARTWPSPSRSGGRVRSECS